MSRTKRDYQVALAAMVMILLAAMGYHMPEANAAAPTGATFKSDVSQARCLGKVRVQSSKWGHNSIYASPKYGAGMHMVGHDVGIVANLNYHFCKNAIGGGGDDFRRVKPISVNVCWFTKGEKGSLFDGIKYDTYFYSNVDGNTVNFAKQKVKDDGTKQHCESQAVPVWARTWAEMDNKPRWNMWSKVERNFGFPDEAWENWRLPKSEVKRIRPGKDFIVKDWSWGGA